MERVIDCKKPYKDLYQPKTMPTVVDMEEMQFVAIFVLAEPKFGFNFVPLCQLLNEKYGNDNFKVQFT